MMVLPLLSMGCLQAAYVPAGVQASGSAPGVAPAPASPTMPVASASPAPSPSPAQRSLLVWNGKGVNVTDLECLIGGLLRQGIPFQLVNEADLGGLGAAELAAHLGLMFPDGSTSAVLAQLPQNVVAVIQDAVKNHGLRLVAVGGTSAVPSQMGLTPKAPGAGSFL